MKNKIYIIISFLFISASIYGQQNVKNEAGKSEVKIDEQNSIEENIDFTQGDITTDSITLKNITVTLIQKKPPKNNYNYNYSCDSKITVSKNKKIIDSLIFKKIEANGGNFGLTNPLIINNHIILTKHGDYDGRTILINENGNFFNIIGGENFIDKEAGLLFTIFDSDISGFAIFDLKSDSLLMSIDDIEDRPKTMHKNFSNRYFMSCINDETNENTIWEFELDLDRIMQVDLDSTIVNKNNQLKMIDLGEANCLCK